MDDCLTLAGADIDHLIGVLEANGNCNGNDYAYKEIPVSLWDENRATSSIIIRRPRSACSTEGRRWSVLVVSFLGSIH